jgi:hypothetical protein
MFLYSEKLTILAYFENGHFSENLREPLFQYFSLV